MAGLWTRLKVRIVAATSASLVSRPYCAQITSYPSACRGGSSLLKHDPSAQIPWANTMLGLTCGDIAPPFSGWYDTNSITAATGMAAGLLRGDAILYVPPSHPASPA